MASQDQKPTPPAWTVTAQTETVGSTTTGQIARGYQVAFRTAGGQQGSVFVPRAQYTADVVRALITEHARELDAIAGLTA
jgi:hypothetical protein